jgi:glycolate oxidase
MPEMRRLNDSSLPAKSFSAATRMNSPQLKKFSQLKKLLPAGELLFKDSILEKYSGDKWFATHKPDAVALPRTTASVAALLRFANRLGIPVTARGAGYGYVGGCVPIRGGIVLSLERMNRIKEINAADFVAVVQPGVITEKIQIEAEKQKLFYPPDPASKADSSIGGNIATNAGGPRCLKYGVTRDYVLGLEVVLANGTVCRVGARTHKNKTGFEFARFFPGSEGMLGIITEATLKLIPLPPYRACLAIGFGSMRDAVRTTQAIFKAGFLPCALEVADAFTLAAAYNRTKSERLRGCRAHLIV